MRQLSPPLRKSAGGHLGRAARSVGRMLQKGVAVAPPVPATGVHATVERVLAQEWDDAPPSPGKANCSDVSRPDDTTKRKLIASRGGTAHPENVSFLTLLALVCLGILLVGHLGIPERTPPQPEADPSIMVGAEPYRMEGESGVGFVISHGYGGSPFNTRPLGQFLHGLGHSVIGVRLPGHGTTIQDMDNSRYAHWRDHLERVYLEERGRYRHLFLVGFSMGGTLVLDVASRNADTFRPAGILTIATPVFFNGFFNGRLVLHSPVTALTGILKIVRPIVKREDTRTGSLDRMNPWVGYRSDVSMRALHSFKRAFSSVRRGLGRIAAPYCSIMAANDRTVSSENQAYIYRNIHSREKRAYMFTLPSDVSTMHSLLTHERANKRVFGYVESFVRDILQQIEGRRRTNGEEGRGLGPRLRRILGMERKAQNLTEPGGG